MARVRLWILFENQKKIVKHQPDQDLGATHTYSVRFRLLGVNIALIKWYLYRIRDILRDY